MLTELSLSYSIVYNYNGAQWYEQFLQVGRLNRALILLGLAFSLPSASVVYLYLIVTFLTLPFSELSLVGLPFDLRQIKYTC